MKDTHEMTEYIKELDKVPYHRRFSSALRVVHHDIGATESSRLMYVLESRMDWLRAGRTGKGS